MGTAVVQDSPRRCYCAHSVREGHLGTRKFLSLSLPCFDLSASRDKLCLMVRLIAEFSACCLSFLLS